MKIRLGLLKELLTNVVLLGLLTQAFTAAEQTNSTGCYCLKELKRGLRNPVHMEETVINGENVFLIGEQRGIIHKFYPKTGHIEPYIDLRDEIVSAPDPFDERGLLGFALHPNFKTNKRLFTYSIRGVGGQDYVTISEVTDQDLKEEKLLMMIGQPGSRRNGGQVK